jgi:NAD(P)H-dependent flavin oxidoreductase YrpB (nitropropane dioxygenase family)
MLGLPPAFIREQIAAVRAATTRPFGVNLGIPLLQGGEVEACLEENVPLLSVFWGDPAPFVRAARGSRARVVVQIGSVDEARRAADAGVDAVIAQGVEAGGHVRGRTALSVLVPAVVDAVAPLPVVAAGGIADARGLVAALDLGARAVSMGTRFLCSEEAVAHPAYKQRVVASHADETLHADDLFDVGWPSAPHRVLRNRAVVEWEAAGRPPSGSRPGEGTVFAKGAMGPLRFDLVRYSAAPPMPGFEGDIEYAALYAGESCELIHDIRPAAEILSSIVRDAEAILAARG